MASAIRAQFVTQGEESEYFWDRDRRDLYLMLVNNEIVLELQTPKRKLCAGVFYAQPPASIPLVTGRIDWSPIRERIARCSPRTNKTSVLPEMPRGFRLIDVDNLRLVSDFPRASRLGSDVKFVTLSYVWGNSNASKENALLGCNESKLSADGGLRQDSMPRAVADAITVCQQLRKRFLWVDRFCIQQDDSGPEKQAQINAMGDIFSSAEFTIVHASGICMDDPIPGVSTAREVLQSRASVCGLELVSGYPDFTGVMTLTSQTTWNGRGWTYQESVLCPRRLIFTSHEVWFECDDNNSPYWREHFIRHTGRIVDSVGSSGLLGHRLKGLSESDFDSFRRHLKQYTARSLSHKSDMVNAFTGVLTALYDGDLSIHGLPEADFDRAVLWHAETEPPTSLSGQKHFPSWSWASAGSSVTFPLTSRPGKLMGPLVHWTYKCPIGELRAIESSESFREGWHQEPFTYLLAAWRNGCLEATIPDDLRHASVPVCGGGGDSDGTVQRCWIERLCEHLERRETCEECESYIEQRWPSLDQLWTYIRESAGRQGIHDPNYGSCILDRSLTENPRPSVLFTRAQTARIRVGKQRDRSWGPAWRFVDAEGRRIGRILPEEERTTATGLQAYLHGDLAECLGVSLSHAWYPASGCLKDDDGDGPVVNVLIIDRREGSVPARRIGVGWIYLWD